MVTKNRKITKITETIGHVIINIGNITVGQSTFMGMYEPKIPDKLKQSKTVN